MEIIVYVSSDADRSAAESLLDEIRHSSSERDGLILTCENLYGSVLDAVPAVVLQVMRIKKVNTMPLTVVDGHPVVSGVLPSLGELRDFIEHGVSGPASFVTNVESAVAFKNERRMHISMLVANLEDSVKFYEIFFGQPPTKVRTDYAKFEVEEPPLVISFIPSPDRERIPGGAASYLGVNHLGVQVKSSDVVMQMKDRFVNAGFLAEEELETPCCYAVQTKIWVGDPDGNRWEVYVVTQDTAEEGCGADCPCYQEIAPSMASSALPS